MIGVLQRSAQTTRERVSVSSVDALLEREPDLILELASPDALAAYGAVSLARADVWTVNGTALADPHLYHSLSEAACSSGKRMRLLPGAIAGLDGVSALCRSHGSRLKVTIQRPGLSDEVGLVFVGSARDAARRYPHETNVAIAAALAGSGLDDTTVELVSTAPGGDHRLSLVAEGPYGRVVASIDLRPNVPTGHHPVAASVIAALDRDTRAIWAG